MIVRNFPDTSDNRCNCESWMDHWKNFSGRSVIFCSAYGCLKFAEHGAHVKKVDDDDQSWYIIPLCRDHHTLTGIIELKSHIGLVSANVKETCGKL